jgi:cob(I)alamin adenosyltransferase
MNLERGLVQVYTGEGKGKTTAALGLALRAAGYGLRVHIVQFMKGWTHYGELSGVKLLPSVTLRQFGRQGFVNPQHPQPADFELARAALEDARQAMLSGQVDIVVLDEVNVALDLRLIPLDAVLKLLDERPAQVELVLTGRGAPEELCRRADLVTEMRALKHPYNSGIAARKGIEY